MKRRDESRRENPTRKREEAQKEVAAPDKSGCDATKVTVEAWARETCAGEREKERGREGERGRGPAKMGEDARRIPV